MFKGCSACGSVASSSEQIRFVPFSAWDATANSPAPVLRRNAARLSSVLTLCFVWLLQVRGRLCETVPDCALSSEQLLGCAAVPAELWYSCVWYLRQPQHTKCVYLLLHKLSQFESLSLFSINSYFNFFSPYFNFFSLLSKPCLQVEGGRRTNEEVESYGGRKRERNCKPSKTVTGKVLIKLVLRSVYITSVYLYLYMSIYCFLSFNRICKKKTNLSKLKYRN